MPAVRNTCAAAVMVAPDVITSSTKITDRPANFWAAMPVSANASRNRSYRSAAVAISNGTVGRGRTKTSDATFAPISGAVLRAKISAAATADAANAAGWEPTPYQAPPIRGPRGPSTAQPPLQYRADLHVWTTKPTAVRIPDTTTPHAPAPRGRG